MGKNRKYIAYISVSCSGPNQNTPKRTTRGSFRERSNANLKCTTADSNWFYSHLHSSEYNEHHTTTHIRLTNPSSEEFASALLSSIQFLKQYIKNKDWDGGGIVLIYAGHGLKNSGALVFTKNCLPLYARDMVNFLSSEIPESGHRLRIDAFFDSCYSGAFLAKLLWTAHNECNDNIFPCTLFASSLPNETARERDQLNHGVFTFSYIQGIEMPSLAQPKYLLIPKMLWFKLLAAQQTRHPL